MTSSGRQFDSRLPPYRPAPDYETAVRNKYGSGVLARINQTPQPNRFQQQQQQQQQQQLHQHQYSNGGLHTSQPTLITDVLTNVYNNNNSSVDPRFAGADTSYNVYHTNLLNATPSNAYSTSTPELNKINQTFHQPQQQQQQQQHYQQLNASTQMLHQYASSNRIDHIQPTQDQIVAELQRLNIYKPPPPYPGRNSERQNTNIVYQQHQQQQQQQQRMMSSTSTPDLAGQFVSRQQVRTSEYL
jgi:hypothetical protein